MRTNKKIILISGGISLTIAAVVASLVITGNQSLKVKSQNEDDKYLVLDNTNTYDGSGKNSVTTSTGQYVVDFQYDNAAKYSTGHVTLNENGTLVNTKQLKSVTYLEVNWSGSGKLQAKTSFGGGVYGSYFDIVSGHKYQFGSNPYYVAFTATGGSVNIDSVKYYFSCVDNPESHGHETKTKYQIVKDKSEINTGDIVYITGKEESGSLLSMSTKAENTYFLKGATVTDNEGIIESGGTEWTVTKSGDNYIFSVGETDLYCYQSGNYYNLKFGSSAGGSNLWSWSVDSTGIGALTSSLGGHLVARSEKGYFRGFADSSYSLDTYPIYLYKKVSEIGWNIPKDEVGFSASDANANVYTTESVYSTDNALTVVMNYSDGTTKTLSSTEYTYKVSSDKAGTMIINPNSAFGKSGTYYVTVSVGDHIPSIIPINVSTGVTSIKANMENTNYKTSDTVVFVDNLTATLTYEDETTKVVKYANFDDYGISAQLLDPNGIVHSITEPFGSAGTWSVKVSYKTFEASVSLNVSAVPVEDITVQPSSYSLYAGESVQLTVTFTPSEPTIKTVTWSSSDAAIASVDTTGLVTAHSVGSATITATSTDGGKTASCAITVKKSATETATIDFNTGHTDTSTAMTSIDVSDFDVSKITLNSVSCYKVYGSGDTSKKYVRVSSGSYGGNITFNFDSRLVKGISINAALYKSTEASTVSAVTSSHTTASEVSLDSTDFKYYDFTGFESDTSESTSVTFSSSTRFFIAGVKLTLKSADPIYPTAISLNKSETTIAINDSETLVPSYTPEDANQTDTTWSSSNESVATVSNGIVTGKASGSATITATTKDEGGNDLTATCVVTVQTVHVTSVSLSPESASINIDATTTLTPTILPTNASDKTVSYSSSNTGVAKVNSDGVVTGISEGTATITVTTNDGGFTATSTITVLEATAGYQHIDSSELTATSKDYNEVYAPTSGTAKVLIVPITLKDSSTGSWDDDEIQNLNDYFFGSSAYSFANYYKSVSHNKITMSGMVVKPYQTSTATTTLDNYEDSLFDMFDSAIANMKTNYPTTDWTEYDLNNDGYFDSIHFLCNYNAQTDSNMLWPHQYQTDRDAGTSASPKVNNYSLSDLYLQDEKMTDSITQVHEQGHIFGIDDYYDYTYKEDYIGSADMQDCNMFEWNSFSKLSAGWASPYVVDGTNNDFTLTMSSAATSEDCLIIPADYSTWNGSAFDEYFVVELFTNSGLNSYFWNSYTSTYSSYGASLPSSGYGVRIYHVDARICKSSGGDQIDPQDWDLSKYSYIQGCNNSKDATQYPAYNENWKNYALLQLVQATGTNTHSSNLYMKSSDLFQSSGVFNWTKASKFLRKDGTSVSTMDDGETFPWSIEFTAMSKTSVTMRVTHN